MTVRCRTCHRVEEWTGDTRVIVSPGGARRAMVPGRAALAVLTASWKGELGPVVAVCPGCDQPMVAEDPSPGVDYAVQLPSGPVVFGADLRIHGPDGELTLEDARRLIHRSLPRAEESEIPGFGLFQGSLLLFMLAPFAVWLFTVSFVTFFLYKFPIPTALVP